MFFNLVLRFKPKKLRTSPVASRHSPQTGAILGGSFSADRSDMLIDELTETVIGCGIAVHTKFGPGLIESVYHECMVIELVANALLVEVEKRVPLVYREQQLRDDLRLDLLVDGRLIVEVKAVERIHPVHVAQVITYLKLTGCPAGLLMNFNATTLTAGLKRLDHPDIYAEKQKARLAAAEEKRQHARSLFSKKPV